MHCIAAGVHGSIDASIHPCKQCDKVFLTQEELHCHDDYEHDTNLQPQKMPVPAGSAGRRKSAKTSLQFNVEPVPKIQPQLTSRTRSGSTPKKPHSATKPKAAAAAGSAAVAAAAATGDADKDKVKEEILPAAQLVLRPVDPNLHYFCMIEDCQKGFAVFTELSAHMITHKVNFFKCLECSEIFLDLDVFQLHQNMHIPKDKDAGKSGSKKKKEETTETLEVDVGGDVIAKCEYVGPKTWRCSLCEKLTTRKDDYTRHLKACKKNILGRHIKCRYCTVTEVGEPKFITHLQQTHKLHGKLLCDTCLSLFKSEALKVKHKCSATKKTR